MALEEEKDDQVEKLWDWDFLSTDLSKNTFNGNVRNVIVRMLLNRIDEHDFENVEIFVNDDESLFKGSYLLLDVFRFLKIPFETFTYNPDSWQMKEINKDAEQKQMFAWLHNIRRKQLTFKTIKVSGKVDFKILHLLLSIAEEIFDNKIDVCIHYGNCLKLDKPRITFGAFDDTNINWTNVSAKIKPNRITELNIKNTNWEKIAKKFPIIKEDRDGKIRSYEKGLSNNDWKRDVGTGYEDGDVEEWRDREL